MKQITSDCCSPIDTILSNLSNYILQLVSGFSKAVYLARIDSEGRIMIQSEATKNEFVYSGISDTESNYFYIRHRDGGQIFYEESANSRQFSCQTINRINSRYELRLVAVQRNWCSYNLEHAIRTAMLKAKFQDFDEFRMIQIKPVQSTIDAIAVLSDESPKPKTFDKALNFVAIDFDIVFELNYL
jgi:hypothetical protein